MGGGCVPVRNINPEDIAGLDPLDKAVVAAATSDTERKLTEERHKNRLLRHQLKNADARVKALAEQLDIVTDLTGVVPDPPDWLAPEPLGKHRGTPILFLSDTHFDEVVDPTEIMGLNAYNRSIGEQRLRRAFEGAVQLPQTYLGSNLQHDGIVLAHGGDLITGEIHDELTETNESKPPETIEYFLDPMIAGIKLLREEYGKVHVVEVDGNHDRLYRKKRSKGRARESWSWLFWKVLAREFKRHSTVTFQVPDSPDVIFPVYDTRIYLHHGDSFRGGGGIAGPLTPLAIGHYRTSRKHADAVRYTGNHDLEFDLILQGHIHHRNSIPGIITGGALKGYDEFASDKRYPYEPASQELLIVTPERGVTFQAPIYVADPVAEGWA